MRYPKECVLKECKEAIIRPFDETDQDLLIRFYKGIPEEDRWFMNYNAMDREIMQKWMDGVVKGSVTSIVAICEEKIVGQGSLYTREFGATSHVGRFRIVVLPDFRKKRLGTWLLLDLVQLAMDKGLEMLRTDLVCGVEDAAIEAVQKFDFFRRAKLNDYIRDINGNRHDLVIMTKNLHKVWSDY